MYTQQIYAWTALTGYEFPYLAALSRSHARVCIKTSLSLCLNTPLYPYAYTPMLIPLCPPILPAYMPPVLNTSWLDGWPQEYKAEPWLERLCSASPQITILIHYCIHFFLFLLPKLINLWGKNYSTQALDLLIMVRPATICGHPEIYFCRSWSIHFVQNLVSCSQPSCGPGSWCWDCAARSSGNLYLRAIHFFGTYQSRTTVFRDIPNLAKKNAFNLAELRLSFKLR